MRIAQVTPGIHPIPPNGWGAVEKIIWEYKCNFEKLGHQCDVLYLDDVDPNKYDIIHIHIANLALLAKERNIPYYFTCHDHHAYLYGKESYCFKSNYESIKNSVKSFVPAKYLVDYFDLPNLYYLSHGVNTDFFKPNNLSNEKIKLLCVANNGFIHDQSEDRKGFSFAIEAAKKLNLPITIAGPKNNKHFFDKYDFNYDKLNIIYDLSEKQLLEVYQNHDIFIHASTLEAGHPNLTLLEAMASGLVVLGTFEENNILPSLIKINRNTDEIVEKIKIVLNDIVTYKTKSLNSAKNLTWDKICQNLIDITSKNNMTKELENYYLSTSILHKEPKKQFNKILINFNDGCKVEVVGNINNEYKISFIDSKTDKILFDSNITNNMWTKCSKKYYIDWKIKIEDLNTKQIQYHKLNLKNRKVKIINESPSIGDTIAWLPVVKRFQKVHDCEVHFYTPHKDLFENTTDNIKLLNYNETNNEEYLVSYSIGYFDPENRDFNPIDSRLSNLQEIACNILGLKYENECPNIKPKNLERTINEKYVCISTASTAGCKHWNNENGWQEVVDYLNNKGYKIVVVQNQSLDYMGLKPLKNVTHVQTQTLQEAASILYHCDFYIGLGSGISWLAWALNKKVIMISGFSKPFAEFPNQYRIINENVCNGCWNDINYKFNGGDWNWCPKHKNTERQFECSKSITSREVIKKIDDILGENNIGGFKNFDVDVYNEIFLFQQYELFQKIDKNDFVVDLGCSKGYLYLKNRNKNINYIGIDGSIDCLNDFVANLNDDDNPILINALIDSKVSIYDFPSMFHGNKINKTISFSIPQLFNLINRKIDFLKFDIEGFEKFLLKENYDLFKKNVRKFSGEFHFLGNNFSRSEGYETLQKLKNDSEIKFKLYSLDGVDITDYFWTNPNFYNEIIINGLISKT